MTAVPVPASGRARALVGLLRRLRAVALWQTLAYAALATAAPATDSWWQSFDDPQLDALMAQAGRDSPGPQDLSSRMARAAATWRAGATPPADTGIDLAVELDLLRGARRPQPHDEADAPARLLMQAALAQAWLQWRAAVHEQGLQLQALQHGRELLALAEGGSSSDRLAAQAALQADEVELQQLALRRVALEHTLAQLAGPAPLALAADAGSALQPRLPPVPAGLDSHMLLRRADVAALQRACRGQGSASDASFPALALTATAGRASGELLQWLATGGAATADPACVASSAMQAGAAHREQVLTVLREVNGHLATLRALAAQAQRHEAASLAAADQADRAATLQARGLQPAADTLRARRAELQQQRQCLQVQAAQRVATVALVRALGGGWGPVSPLVAAR